MKNLMTKTLRTLAVAGMTMGLALGAKAAEPVEYLEPVYKTAGVPTSGIDHWETKSVTDYQLVTKNTATLSAGWWVVDGTVSRNGTITVEGAVHLILKDGCLLMVTGPGRCAGIKVSGDGNSLAIYGQSTGTGKLNATGGVYGAGIGGGELGKGSDITINGGTVTATGRNDSAGIGGGSSGAGSNITINGGTVTATGGLCGAGIGGGGGKSGSSITINDGTVKATGADGGAGIGGGSQGAGSNITINGGTVTASGSSADVAAIGSGSKGGSASGIYVNPILTLKADGNNPPTTVIKHASITTDLASDLAGKRYATAEPPAKVSVTGVENATWVAYTNEVPLTGEQPYTVTWGTIVKVVYTLSDGCGKMFPGGYKTLTTNLTASAATVTVTVTLTAEQQPRPAVACKDCLTFSSKGEFKVQLKKMANGAPTVNLEYSKNKTYWSPYVQNTDYDAEQSGDGYAIYLRGTNNTQFATSDDMLQGTWNTFNFTTNGTDGVACSGNIETLLDHKIVKEGGHPKMDNYAFLELFKVCTSLTTAPELSAMNLSDKCYASMFYGCTSLTAAPNLPATTLAKSCYASMFSGCGALPTAPNLPATTLAESCYRSMFNGCTSLTTAPDLPATNLASTCYYDMFSACTSLTTAPNLPATNLATSCYSSMFSGCSSLTDLPVLPATNLKITCYYGMFQNCSSLIVNSGAPGKEWSIPSEATGAPMMWNEDMFSGTGGDFTGAPEVGVTYYVKSAWKPVTVTLPEVAGATAQLYTFYTKGGWTSVATNEVPSNATVRVVWTAEDGKALSGEGAMGVFQWQTEFVASNSVQTAPQPIVGKAGESEITLNIDTRAVKKYFEKDDILPIWAAQDAEVEVEKVGGEKTSLVKNMSSTNTFAWVPAEQGTYNFSQSGFNDAQIIYTTPVEVTTNDLEVSGTTVAVTADGSPIEPQTEEPYAGKLMVASNSTVTATWTATGSGVYFMDGNTTYTQTFEASQAVNPVSEAVTKPDEPKAPKLLLGVVAQRYPWDGKIDVQYWAKNTPNEGYQITITVTLPDGTTASDPQPCKNGKNTVAFDARAKFGEVQFPKGVKVKATLIPSVELRPIP